MRTIIRVIAVFFSTLALASLSMSVTTPAMASSNIRLIVRPKPVEAPSQTTFIVVSDQIVPTHLVLQLNGQKPIRLTLKKEAAHDYAASHFIRSTGRLKVVIAGKNRRLLLQKSYTVVKGPSDIVTKVIVAALFFGVSFWYWRKAQRYTHSPKSPGNDSRQ